MRVPPLRSLGLFSVLLCWIAACGDDDAASILDATIDASADAELDSSVDASIDARTDSGFDAARDAQWDATFDHDAGTLDAGDAGAVNPGYTVKLSETGLYADIATDTIADNVLAFAPAYALWTDAAEKRRFLYLPPNRTIDTSDMDHWAFPVGTKAWKEFSRDGVRVETRLLEKTERGWLMLAYVWNVERTEALATLTPIENALGTEHDVPSRGQCLECHGGQPDRLLGFSAIQLSHNNGGLTLAQLIADNRLSDPPAVPFTLPGDALDQATLGMLHANCGSCHTPGTVAFERADGMELWLTVDSLSAVATTTSYRTTVGVDLTYFEHASFSQRIVAGEPEQSALWFRMGSRGGEAQMPPLGTELVDTVGVDRLSQWIRRLN